MVGKLIVHGKSRPECLMRLKRALDEFVVDGIDTTLPLFQRARAHPGDIVDGNYHIHWLEQFLAQGRDETSITSVAAARRDETLQQLSQTFSGS